MNQQKTKINWQQLQKEWEQSGKSQKRFCEQRGVSYYQFKNKRYLHGKRQQKGMDTHRETKNSSSLIPIQVKTNDRVDSHLQLHLPHGGWLTLPAYLNVEELKEMLQGLGFLR